MQERIGTSLVVGGEVRGRNLGVKGALGAVGLEVIVTRALRVGVGEVELEDGDEPPSTGYLIIWVS